MRPSRWPLFGMIAAGSLATGSCAGALAGNFTVTGGLYPKSGWAVPNFGSEDVTANLPPAGAVQRVEVKSDFAGYYPDTVPMVTTAEMASAASRQIDAIYATPEPIEYEYAGDRDIQPPLADAAADDWPEPPAPSADVEAYFAGAEAGVATD